MPLIIKEKRTVNRDSRKAKTTSIGRYGVPKNKSRRRAWKQYRGQGPRR